MTKTYENRRFMRSEVAIPITLQFGSYEFLRGLIAENAEDSFACDTEIISNMGNLPPLY